MIPDCRSDTAVNSGSWHLPHTAPCLLLTPQWELTSSNVLEHSTTEGNTVVSGISSVCCWCFSLVWTWRSCGGRELGRGDQR